MHCGNPVLGWARFHGQSTLCIGGLADPGIYYGQFKQSIGPYDFRDNENADGITESDNKNGIYW